MRHRAACITAALLAFVTSVSLAPARAAVPPPPEPFACEAPVPDVDPADLAAWMLRDLGNVACGYQRQYDELSNPAFLRTWAAENAEAAGVLPAQLAELLAEPTRPRLNPTRLPPAKVTDPFRSPSDWEAAGRGQTQRFQFTSKTGAKLYARLFSPNPSASPASRPGIVFSPGLFSFNEVNLWFAESMAEAGYIVMIIDPQGQGDSETFSHNRDGSIDCADIGCGAMPLENEPGFESAIDFFFSTPSSPHPWATGANAEGTLLFNPIWSSLDRQRVGIAGHSLGAIAATGIGQRDRRVKAVIAYDNFDERYADAEIASAHAPTLFFSTDYAFPEPPLPEEPGLGPRRGRAPGGVHPAHGSRDRHDVSDAPG